MSAPRQRPLNLSRQRVVWGVRVWAFTVDVWSDRLVIGRVGGLARWQEVAHFAWRVRSWREVLYVRGLPPWRR